MLLDKHYQGDLQARAQGQMLSVLTPTAGSAGHVAIEQVSGRLQCREGSCVLQHSDQMDRDQPRLPRSRAGALRASRLLMPSVGRTGCSTAPATSGDIDEFTS